MIISGQQVPNIAIFEQIGIPGHPSCENKRQFQKSFLEEEVERKLPGREKQQDGLQ